MSYEIAKNFTVDLAEMKIKGSFASSNVYPKTYEKWEFVPGLKRLKETGIAKIGKMTPREIFKVMVLQDLIGRNIQLGKSVYFRYRYALLKVSEELNKNGFLFWENSSIIHKSVEELKEIENLGDIVNELNKYTDIYFYYAQEAKVEKGDYVVEIESNGYFLVKMNQVTYKQTPIMDNAKIYNNKWEAELEASMLPERNKIIELASLPI